MGDGWGGMLRVEVVMIGWSGNWRWVGLGCLGLACSDYNISDKGEPSDPGEVADAVPEACLGYPDYKYGRGNGFFKKGSSARAFYKKNGYHKLKVYKAGGYNRGKVVYKFFKEVVKSA